MKNAPEHRPETLGSVVMKGIITVIGSIDLAGPHIRVEIHDDVCAAMRGAYVLVLFGNGIGSFIFAVKKNVALSPGAFVIFM